MYLPTTYHLTETATPLPGLDVPGEASGAVAFLRQVPYDNWLASPCDPKSTAWFLTCPSIGVAAGNLSFSIKLFNRDG